MKLKVYPSRLEGRVRAPPSKSYTHRVLFAASLAEGVSRVRNPLQSRDTLATMDACAQLGVKLRTRRNDLTVESAGRYSLPSNVIDVKNSGTTLRFATALCTLAEKGYVVLTGDESIRRRPMQPMLDALGAMNITAFSTRNNGCAPIVVGTGGLRGGEITVRGDISSQFTSGLLMALPKAEKDSTLKVQGARVSLPYVEATIYTLKQFGVKVMAEDDSYLIPGNQSYRRCVVSVPGDFSSASFIMAGAAVTGGRVTISGLDFDAPQADSIFPEILRSMGGLVTVRRDLGEVTVEGGSTLKGGIFNLSNSPDLAPVMASLLPVTEGEIQLTGVEHLRYKETDRITTLTEGLRKVGYQAHAEQNGITMRRGPPKRAVLDSHGDHRLLMAFTIIGLSPNCDVTIRDSGSVDVSYPRFIDDLQALGGNVKAA